MQQRIELFISYLKDEKKAADNTVQSYERDLRHFATYLSDANIQSEKVNETCVIGYILYMQKKGAAASSITRSLASIRSMYKYLNKKGLVRTNPAERLSTPKAQRKLPAILSEEDVTTLLNLPDESTDKGLRDKAMLELLYATGLRASELISLSTQNVNTRLSYIRCVSHERERIIPIGSKAADALAKYMDTVRPKMLYDQNDDTLFLNRNGAPMTRQGFWKTVKHYAAVGNIKGHITPQGLRHAFAAHLIAHGADVQSVQEMLGHADISTTQLYANLKKDKLRDIYAKTHPRY